jgi:hypothetical protein
MKNLNNIAEDLFNKIRGRFPSVTIGDAEGNVTNVPTDARFFDFDYKEGGRSLGKVSITLDEENIAVMYSNDFVANEDQTTQDNWYNFLRELRQFSKKRLLNFDTRNITKSNLNRRDYKFLATNRSGDGQMNESKMYGTSRVSYQDIGEARIMIKHTESVNQELATGRTQKIGAIYVESSEGERFKYPYKHLSGARAMARHVAEGGKPFDDFGKHITSLSEELAKLKKFKTYMGRSSVMAESLAGYMDVVKERIATVKKTVESLQKSNYYKETFEAYEAPVLEDVPEDVAENWIDQLTIKQFNEELKDVFPYIYNLVSEATRAKQLGPEDLGEAEHAPYYVKNQGGKLAAEVTRGKFAPVIASTKWDEITPDVSSRANRQGFRTVEIEYNNMKVKALLGYSNSQGSEIVYVSKSDFDNMSGPEVDLSPNAERGDQVHINQSKYESEIEAAFEKAMGQFGSNSDDDEDTIDVKMNPDGSIEKAEKEEKTPLGEFILSYFDRETGQFPKGETAILTMVEKDYGEKFIEPAKQFIEMINNRMAEMYGFKDQDVQDEGNAYAKAVRQAKMNGKKKGDKIQGPDDEEIVLASQEENDIMRLAGL